MNRDAAVAAVVEAAREWQHSVRNIEPRTDEECEAYEAFDTALHALDALPSEPEAGKGVVEVAVWEHADGDIRLARIGTQADNWAAWTRLGITRLRVAGKIARRDSLLQLIAL